MRSEIWTGSRGWSGSGISDDDAYLRDAQLGGQDFFATELGRAIFGATAQTCGPLMAWFPQALLYGFW